MIQEDQPNRFSSIERDKGAWRQGNDRRQENARFFFPSPFVHERTFLNFTIAFSLILCRLFSHFSPRRKQSNFREENYLLDAFSVVQLRRMAEHAI